MILVFICVQYEVLKGAMPFPRHVKNNVCVQRVSLWVLLAFKSFPNTTKGVREAKIEKAMITGRINYYYLDVSLLVCPVFLTAPRPVEEKVCALECGALALASHLPPRPPPPHAVPICRFPEARTEARAAAE